jgi:hypothetical protein
MKKTYEVELRRTSFITVTVEAETQEQAEYKAWQEINYDPVNDSASWGIEFIEEQTK